MTENLGSTAEPLTGAARRLPWARSGRARSGGAGWGSTGSGWAGSGSTWRPAGLGSLPLAGAVAGLGWHFSTVLLRPDRTVHHPERLVRLDGDRAWFVRTRFTAQPGVWAVRWVGGKALLGPPFALRPADRRDLVGRRWTGPRPEVPPEGLAVGVDCVLNDADPGALGLAFTEVAVPGPLGDYPAWFVPANTGPDLGTTPGSDTWVIAVHGRGMDRRECLRVLPTLHRAGLSVLVVSYRNDPGAPPSPDGWYHLGDTEWRDVEAAARYALGAGARRIVLYGWSMGAAVTGALLGRSALAGAVAGVVWDCPVVDWWATLRRQAAARRLPPALIRVVAAFARARAGIDLDRFALHRRPPGHRPPTLLLHGALDSATPAAASRRMAGAATRLEWPIRYVEVPGAEHTATWNVDPEGYQRAVTDFLADLPTGPTSAVARWST